MQNKKAEAETDYAGLRKEPCIVIWNCQKKMGKSVEEHRVRICDIAQELGLSTATVSNVLHGKTTKVSEETVRRVQELLEKRQYIPSMAGLLLAQNDSRIVGVVVNDHEKYEAHVLEDIFVASSLNHLSREIEKSGQFMMVKTTTDREEIIRFASMWNMDGLVLIGFCDADYHYLRSHMRIPFVVYDGYLDGAERICNLTIDNYDGGFQVGTHFRETGHERALCISDNLVCVDLERCEGFRAGFGGDAAQFMQIPMHKEERWDFYREHLERILTFSAVFAVSDYYAVDLLRFLNEHGIPVPERIALAGFDDTPICSLVSPTLTSVRQDAARRAYLAVENLKKLKEQKETETEIRLPVKLIVRGSSGK